MKFFEETVDQAGDIIFFCDMQGVCTFVNAFTERLIGLSKKEIVGRHFTDFVADEAREEVAKHYIGLLSTHFENDYYEFPVMTSTGNVLWVGQSTNLRLDENGDAIGFFAIARPITKLKSIQHSLSESESKVRSIIDSALDAVIVINEEGIITEWNKQAEQTFGWSKERAQGMRLSETIIPPEFREAHERGMKHFLKTGEGPVLNQRIEITAMHASGRIFPVELTIIPNQIDGVFFFSSFVRDITEAKKSENLLKAINNLAISLLGKTSLDEIAWEITKNTTEQLGFDDCVVYILDEEKEELHQLAAYGESKSEDGKILNPITIPLGKGIVGRVAKIGAPIIIDDTSKEPDYIVDDETRYSELSVPIIEGDKVIGVIDSEHEEKGFYTEEHLQTLTTVANLVSAQLNTAIVNNQKLKAEQSLRESEERWQKLVENQPEAIQITEEGKVVYLNQAGLDLYEATSMEQIVGKNLLELAGNTLRSKFEKRLEQLKKGEKVPSIEFEINTYKGNTKIIEATSSPVTYNGKWAIQTIARDITEKKEAEERKERLLADLKVANDKLNEFAHVVSHDLKAPLRAISSLSEWVVEDYRDSLDEEGKQTLEMIIENVEKMDALIEGILTYSTSTSKKEELETIDLNELIREILNRLHIPDHIKLDVQKGFPKVEFSRVQLGQVIQNLVSNAIKFMDKEKGVIRIGFEEQEEKWLCFVADNGPGIDEEIGNDVFNLFSTFHDSNEGSTGIGLSIIKKIMENHHEDVWFESTSGQGTTFYFTIGKFKSNERSEISITARG